MIGGCGWLLVLVGKKGCVMCLKTSWVFFLFNFHFSKSVYVLFLVSRQSDESHPLRKAEAQHQGAFPKSRVFKMHVSKGGIFLGWCLENYVVLQKCLVGFLCDREDICVCSYDWVRGFLGSSKAQEGLFKNIKKYTLHHSKINHPKSSH